tara:strand:- start:1191 stop:1409 length:219 start_codon:yes stop_codon:yes gene_type:complete
MLGHSPISSAPLSTVKVRVIVIITPVPSTDIGGGGGYLYRPNKNRRGKKKEYLKEDEECILAIIKIFVVIEK